MAWPTHDIRKRLDKMTREEEHAIKVKGGKAKAGTVQPHGKSTILTNELRRRLVRSIKDKDTGQETTVAKLLADRLIEAGLAGDIKAIREIWDRVEGRPKQETEQKVEWQITLVDALRGMALKNSQERGITYNQEGEIVESQDSVEGGVEDSVEGE